MLLGRMSCTTLKPLLNCGGASFGTHADRYPPTIQPPLRFFSAGAADLTKSSHVAVGPPSSSITRFTPAALGTFSALIVNVTFPLYEFLKTSSASLAGTGPITRVAFGSIDRINVPNSHASSHAIIGLSIA